MKKNHPPIEAMGKIAQENMELWALKALIKINRLKRVDRRLQVIKFMLEGKPLKEIAEKTDFSSRWVRLLIAEYKEKGLVEYARHKYGGNHKSLSQEEEDEILASFDERIENGEIVTVSDIKKAFDAKIGKDTGRGYIYMLLKRRDYRKLAPRPRHPKKASDEAIDASKKLTNSTRT